MSDAILDCELCGLCRVVLGGRGVIFYLAGFGHAVGLICDVLIGDLKYWIWTTLFYTIMPSDYANR